MTPLDNAQPRQSYTLTDEETGITITVVIDARQTLPQAVRDQVAFGLGSLSKAIALYRDEVGAADGFARWFGGKR